MFESSRFFVVQARYFLLLCLGGKSLTREGAAEVLEEPGRVERSRWTCGARSVQVPHV